MILLLLGFLQVKAQDIGVVLAEPIEEPTEEFNVAIKTRPLNYLIYPVTFGQIFNANIEAEFPIRSNLSYTPGIQYLYSRSSGVLPFAILEGPTISLRSDIKYYPFAKDRNEYCEGFYFGPYLKIRAASYTYAGGSFFGIGAIPGMMCGYSFVKGDFAASYLIGGGLGVGSNILFLDFRTGISIGFTI